MKRALTGMWGIALLGFLFGCEFFATQAPPEPYAEERKYGPLITDPSLVIDDFPFRSEACEELLPENWANIPAPEAGSASDFVVIATACWKATVIVIDTQHAVIDSFAQPFGITDRQDGEKDRGSVGHLVWDGQVDGKPVPAGEYIWLIRFDFGLGKKYLARALRPWPPASL